VLSVCYLWLVMLEADDVGDVGFGFGGGGGGVEWSTIDCIFFFSSRCALALLFFSSLSSAAGLNM
jgi:hypothetical protein